MSAARRQRPGEGHAQVVLRDQWRRADALLRRLPGDVTPANVHAARVAIRRLRTILSGITPALDAGLLSVVRRDLKRIADQLGKVRDADIRCEILLPAVRPRGRAADRIRPDVAGAIVSALRTERLKSRQRLRTWLRGTAATERLDRLSRIIDGDSFVMPDADTDALLAHAVRRRCGKAGRSLKKGSTSPARRHALRIRVKKCRYLLDACSNRPRRGRGRQFSVLLHDLQDCLGDLNDLEQAQRWLANQDLSSAATRDLRTRLRADAAQSTSRFRRLRRKLRSRDIKSMGI